MMNQTRVLQHIEMMLGVPFQVLEIDEDEIIDVINKYTLPTYSKFYPLYTTIPVYTEKHKTHMKGVYFLESELKILGVSKLLYEGMNMFDHNVLATGGSFNPLINKFRADQMSMTRQPITFEFHAPNMIELFPKNQIMPNFSVQIKAVHPEHLTTIPENMHDEFLKLCVIDVKIALYPIRHRFQNINSTFGNIELFMDRFESAQDDRRELLERWKQHFFKNSKRRKIFVY